MYWGETHLHFAYNQPARTACPGKNHAALRSTRTKQSSTSKWPITWPLVFNSLEQVATYYHSATDDIAGRDVSLNLEDLQAELRIDEVIEHSRPARDVQAPVAD